MIPFTGLPTERPTGGPAMDRATHGINLSGDTVASNDREQAAAPGPPPRIAQGASHRVIGPQTTNNK